MTFNMVIYKYNKGVNMKNEKAKKILKIWIILYLAFTILNTIGLFDIFDNDIIKKILRIGPYPLNITSIILYFYVYTKGEEKIAKIGFYSLVIYFIMCILKTFDVYSLATTSIKFIDKEPSFIDILGTFIYYTSNYAIDICNCIAILSLIKTTNDKINDLKKISIISVICFALIGVVSNTFRALDTTFMNNLRYIADYISATAKYGLIAIYLINNVTIEEKNEESINSTPEQNNNMINQNDLIKNVQTPISQNNQMINGQTPISQNNQMINGQTPISQNNQMINVQTPISQNNQMMNGQTPISQNNQMINGQTPISQNNQMINVQTPISQNNQMMNVQTPISQNNQMMNGQTPISQNNQMMNGQTPITQNNTTIGPKIPMNGKN